MMTNFSLKLSVLGWALLGATCWGQVSDDFDDGNDLGWARLNPLGEVGGSATFSFPGGNTYRIRAGVSPNPEALGQGRAGSLREELDYSAFRVSVDIVEAEGSLDQDFGILARVTTPGLGTLNGYSATFDSDEERLYLSRVDGEEPSTLGDIEVPIEEGAAYRIVFHGYQDQLLVEVFDVADLLAPVVSLSATDGAYVSGGVGLFGSAGVGDGRVDVTFDNFSADPDSDIDQDGMSDPVEVAVFGDLDQSGDGDFDGDGQSNAEELQVGSDPKTIDLIGLEISADVLMVSFKIAGNRSYLLEKSTDLKTWVIDEEAEFVNRGDGVGLLETARSDGPEFVRVRVEG